MTPMLQRLALFAVAGLASACGGSADGPSGVVFDESYAFAPGGEVVATLAAADLEVRTSARPGARVVVEGSREAFERARFTVALEDGRLTVETDPEPAAAVQTGRGLRVTVEVPEDVSVNAEVGSGDVTVGAVRGALAIETGSGDVTTQSVGAAAEVETGSGSVSAGPVAGGVDISTGSGDVSFSVSRSAPVSVETGSGRVEAGLPSGAPFAVGIQTGSGAIDVDDGLGFRGTSTEDDLEGEIGGGGPPLRIGTGSGDVTVRVR